ncbi:NAD(P)H-binding protein [Streptomyces sp. NPDC088261]|uniref:NmrA family NAD(P)-binding protein n=1 Tax=Streptomyces sp. NPDC088261 TaxID=3365851 RepID=UPI00380949F5
MSTSLVSKTVLVSGATGDTGRATVRESLALGLDVRALVRTIDARSQALADLGAEVVVGDFMDPNSLRSAMEGTDAAYLCYPVSPGLLPATVNFAQAAKETGVGTVVNCSQRSANRESTSPSCRDTFIAEQVLDWSGLDVIHLRPTLFLEWLQYFWMLPRLRQGVLSMPVGDGTSSPVAAADQGRAIAALLRHPDEHIGTTIPLSGPAEMNHTQMAAELSEALGRRIVFENPPMDEYAAHLEKVGVPPYGVAHITGAMLDYQNGAMSGADNNIEKITGRRSMTVGEYARTHADLLNGVNG